MFKQRSPELIALTVSLYEELKSLKKVAGRLELGVGAVHKILKDAGLVLPGRHSQEVQERKKSLKGESAKAAAQDYANDMPLTDLRKKYGVGTWAIKTAAKDNGVAIRARGARVRKYSDQEKQDITELYNSGWSQGQIAAKYNASTVMISRLCRAMGIKIRGHRAKGVNHGSWNGGRTKIGQYIAVLVDLEDPMRCMAHHTGYVLEHRLVMARLLGRPLTEDETVHHIDDNKENNNPRNLQLRFGRHGKGVVLKCRCCGSNDIIPVPLAEVNPCESSS